MRPFARLRGAMIANGDSRKDVANALLIGITSLSHKMNGHTPWSSDEMWTLMERYGIEPEEMAKYFPRKGV